MKTQLTPRLEHSIAVLYNAFHNGTLNAFKCKACAVGNIVGHGDWKMHYCGEIHRGYLLTEKDKYFKFPENKFYSNPEIMEVERVFLMEWAKENGGSGTDKEIQFKGLYAVIEYLCELDGVENVMDYTKLFETENNVPVYELQF